MSDFSLKKKDAPVLDKEFRFRLEPERSSREQWSIKLSLNTKRVATLASFSCREERRPSHMNHSTIHAKENQERGRLPQPFKDDIPSIICTEDMRFMARYQPG